MDDTIEYDAILVDTSIFDGNGLRLERGLLGKLSQFKNRPIDYILPDVIKNEVTAHIDKKIASARAALEKSLNDATDHLFFDGSVLNGLKDMLVSKDEIAGLGQSRVAAFIENTGALVLNSENFVGVSKVLEMYFANEAPFAISGKKKFEFPDAIALLAVEDWANQNGKNVLAVAKDSDWKAYCHESKRITYTEDLAQGLAYFNQRQAPHDFVSRLSKAIESDKAVLFLNVLKGLLEGILNSATVDQEAESQFYWEPDGADVWLDEFEIHDEIFQVVDEGENWVSFEFYATITMEGEGDFSLAMYDSIDKDYVPMGGVTVRAKQTFESPLLISVSGDLQGKIDEISVDEVEVLEGFGSMDFGTLELDSGPD
ncbi:MAG: PIN domain-containing protein [Pseudomonadota bacterium]